MERGQQNVTLLTLWHIAQAVGAKPADLLDEFFASGVVGNAADEPPT
jgi:transcriptional regulator with XRE-family HTH domain